MINSGVFPPQMEETQAFLYRFLGRFPSCKSDLSPVLTGYN